MIILRTFIHCDVRGCLNFAAVGINDESQSSLQVNMRMKGWVEIKHQCTIRHICPSHDNDDPDDLVYDVGVGEAV